MSGKNLKKRNYYKRKQPMTRANEVMVIAICVVFVIVGLFFVYRSFAASITK